CPSHPRSPRLLLSDGLRTHPTEKKSAWTHGAVGSTAKLVATDDEHTVVCGFRRVSAWRQRTGQLPAERLAVHKTLNCPEPPSVCGLGLASHLLSFLLEYERYRTFTEGRATRPADRSFPSASNIHQRQSLGRPVTPGAAETEKREHDQGMSCPTHASVPALR